MRPSECISLKVRISKDCLMLLRLSGIGGRARVEKVAGLGSLRLVNRWCGLNETAGNLHLQKTTPLDLTTKECSNWYGQGSIQRDVRREKCWSSHPGVSRQSQHESWVYSWVMVG